MVDENTWADAQDKRVKLPQPPLLDFGALRENDDVRIIIFNTQHKFATDAALSGTDIKNQPIFGTRVLVNGEKISESSFGLPFLRFPRDSTPRITYENQTLFTFNLHYHGLNTVGIVDGASMESVFGPSTLLGPNVTFQFPKITNNQALLWFHSHNMFLSMELAYAGLFGLLQIVDKPTEWLTECFQYGDNQILLEALDMDFTSTGTQTSANLITDENRSNFTTINGISAVNWYSSKPVPFVNPLYHKTTKNLVKIDILNAPMGWRTLHLGVCDEDMKIKPFYLVQSDGGLINPNKITMAFIPVAGRIAIIIDLNEFKNQVAHLFFYNYDLTEIFASMPAFPNQPNNPTLVATIPDFSLSKNPTPYPTPIPDPHQQNQQQNYTNLNYPTVPIIPQTQQILDNGTIKVPREKNIKPFLKIILDCYENQQLSLADTISGIQEVVFGRKTFDEHQCLLEQSCFEYDKKFNYVDFLNKDYFYNLPKTSTDVPLRNLFLFPETDTNAIAGGNFNGTTEYVDGANRIMADLWNSKELDLDWALKQYAEAPNNYKPPTLPTSKFRIYKTNDKFSNTAMISNDTLKIQIFANPIAYGDFSQVPIATATVVFPPTPLPCGSLNLQEWIDLVNKTFQQTTIIIAGKKVLLSTILHCDWSFFPYALDFLYQRTAYIKSAVIKTTNSSNFYIRFLGRWPLLQFFGKALTGSTLDPNADLMSQLREKQQKRHREIRKRYNEANNINRPAEITSSFTLTDMLAPQKNLFQYEKCDEFALYGIYDGEIQQIFPFYATSDGQVQLPIPCMRRDAELIIVPQQTYIGLYDGYLNDNLNSFSVRLHSSEQWLYTNGDCADAHPLHFHLTSGFASTQSNYTSPGLLSCDRLYDQETYSRDIYQVGPQETISFRVHWPHYSSNESTQSPNVRCVGAVTHCHYMVHNDQNSMIFQYYVDPPLPAVVGDLTSTD